jgi:hypothetical protein
VIVATSRNYLRAEVPTDRALEAEEVEFGAQHLALAGR